MIIQNIKSNEYVIDKQRIINGDCQVVLKTFKDEFLDNVITSPPYNIGIKYNIYKDDLSKENYLSWLHKVFSEIKRVLKLNGSIFLNVGSTNTEPWVAFDVANTLRDLFVLQNHIIWIKSISINEESHGHYKPINSDRYTNHMFEHIFHFTKTGKVPINRKSIGVPYKYKVNLKAVTVTEDIRCRGNTWFIPYNTIQTKQDRGDHPAVFPKKLVEWCIKLHGFNSDTIVCDPFLGSGTTLLVTRKLKCKGIGIEIDETYFDYAYNSLISTVNGGD